MKEIKMVVANTLVACLLMSMSLVFIQDVFACKGLELCGGLLFVGGFILLGFLVVFEKITKNFNKHPKAIAGVCCIVMMCGAIVFIAGGLIKVQLSANTKYTDSDSKKLIAQLQSKQRDGEI